MFGRWLNHLTVFGGMWAATFALQTTRFVATEAISATAGWWIVVSLLSYWLGSLWLFSIAKACSGGRRSGWGRRFGGGLVHPAPAIVQGAILTLSLLGVVVVVARLKELGRWVNSLGELFTKSREVYWIKMLSLSSESIPYLAAASLAGAWLAGWALKRGRIRPWHAVLPLLPLAGLAFSTAGRTTIVLGFLLLGFGYGLAPGLSGGHRRRTPLALAVGVLIATVGAISATRNLGGEDFYEYQLVGAGESAPESVARVLASFYLYVAGPPVVFSEYLKEGGEVSRWGENSLGPLRNGLHRLGLDVEPIDTKYQRPYYMPYRMNVGTMLREVHADFGNFGLVLFPLFLGIVSTASLWSAFRGSLVGGVVAAHLLLAAALSTFMNAMRWGDWWGSLGFGVATALLLQTLARQQGGRAAGPAS